MRNKKLIRVCETAFRLGCALFIPFGLLCAATGVALYVWFAVHG